jgi:hypothetical protein
MDFIFRFRGLFLSLKKVIVQSFRLWTKFVHSPLVTPSQVTGLRIEFKLRLNGYEKSVYYSIH